MGKGTGGRAMRYLLIGLTLAAAVAFVISLVVEVGWVGGSTHIAATHPATSTSTGSSHPATPQPTATAQQPNILAYYFAGPSDVKVGPGGHIFVADTFNGRVVELGK